MHCPPRTTDGKRVRHNAACELERASRGGVPVRERPEGGEVESLGGLGEATHQVAECQESREFEPIDAQQVLVHK